MRSTGDRRAGASATGTSRAAPREGSFRTADQAVYDGPPIDETITGKELDRSVAQQLRGLPEKLAARVARHLVAAGLLMDTDPKTAYQHTLAARARAARIAVVREACGEAAYAAGEYAEALSELRAAKRMNGAQDYLAVMADCERALGRPDRALALAHNPAVADFAPDLKAEVTIVEAGARRDRGEIDAALRTLEAAPLRSARGSPGWPGCATRTPTPCWPRAARTTPSSGSTARWPSTATRSPTPPNESRSSSSGRAPLPADLRSIRFCASAPEARELFGKCSALLGACPGSGRTQ